jgi:antiviral defense system Shedu protein SduA
MQGSDFKIGADNFPDLEMRPSGKNDHFYYFYDTRRRQLVTMFVLLDSQNVTHFCHVSLIEKDGRFTPRLHFSIRNKDGKVANVPLPAEVEGHPIKASVSLVGCHESFWKLIQFLESLRNVEIPRDAFSLVLRGDAEIASALSARGANSLIKIIRELSRIKDVSLTEEDVNQLLKRKEKLLEFEKNLHAGHKEVWWQDFFEANKWIFGYGLDYQILRQEQPQPVYRGPRLDGKGGQRGDFLHSTVADVSFTVLVEIKKPSTPLLQGQSEIRSGTWSLSQDLTDALAQIQTNVYGWEQGADEPENRDLLEAKGIYTVRPKGIVVVGLLRSISEPRSKRETFQRFRQSVHGIEILTFDELYNRAKFIVEHRESRPQGD